MRPIDLSLTKTAFALLFNSALLMLIVLGEIPKGWIEDGVAWLGEFISNTMRLVNEKCHPMFHHEYALSRLNNEGYRIAVCSNSIRNTICNMMDKAALTHYLDLIVSNEDVTKAKPDPEMYLTAISRFGLKPDECVVVEDNPNGVKAGLASGAYVLQVETVYDVNYTNIRNKIDEVEA